MSFVITVRAARSIARARVSVGGEFFGAPGSGGTAARRAGSIGRDSTFVLFGSDRMLVLKR